MTLIQNAVATSSTVDIAQRERDLALKVHQTCLADALRLAQKALEQVTRLTAVQADQPSPLPDHPGEYLYRAMNNMIDLVEFQRTQWPEYLLGAKASNSLLDWHKQYNTIRISGPRRSGHSTAILRTCSRFESSAIITMSEAMQSDMGVRLKSLSSEPQNITIYTSPQIERHMARGCFAVQAVFVDCSFYLSPKAIDRIYEELGTSTETLFILL